MFWNWEMALISGEAKYSDLFEWQLYNAAGVGMGWSGTDYLYNNPLACRGGITRKPWFAVPCCPSNLSRTWANLGRYIFSSKQDSIWVHQYIGCTARLNAGVQVDIQVVSGLPWSGNVGLQIHPTETSMFSLFLRRPSWVGNQAGLSTIKLNGQGLDIQPALSSRVTSPSQKAAGEKTAGEKTAGGYDPRRSEFFEIRRAWSPGDELEIEFDLPIVLQQAHPKVKGHRGKVAVTRGPLVYCLESLDNPDVDIFTCRLDPASLMAETALELFDGATIIRGKTQENQHLTFIPYFLWANRGESHMTVWVNV
jgi:DUF1680 family protein